MGRPRILMNYETSMDWGRLRNKLIDFYDGRCQICGGRGDSVHHNTYERYGHERLTDLVLLCSLCHGFFHGRLGMNDRPALALVANGEKMVDG